MTTTATLPATKTADLLLVRLLPATKTPPAPSKVRDDLNKLRQHPLDAEGWRELVSELAEAGLLSAKPLRLTDAGRARALAYLGVEELPSRTDWKALRDRHLVPLALGLPADAESRKRIKNADGLGALLLKREYDLPAGSGQSIKAALKALACKQLGFPQCATLEEVLTHALSRLLESPDVLTRKQLAKHLPLFVVKARKPDLASMREAVLRTWVGGEPEPKPAAARPSVEPEPFDLATFANTVRAAARDCPTGRFGEDKVFISHVWRRLEHEPIPVRSLAEFKVRLAEANHDGLLALRRADLVQALDPADVAESEISYLTSTFHFVVTERDRP